MEMESLLQLSYGPMTSFSLCRVTYNVALLTSSAYTWSDGW